MIKKIIMLIVVCLCTCSLYADTFIKTPDVFESSTQQSWANVENQINASKDTHIYLLWGGYGGDVDMMLQFINVIKSAERHGKYIIFVLTNNAYSAHAVSACYASSIIHNDKYFLMFHPLADDNAHPLTDPISVNSYKPVLAECVRKGILTVADVTKSLSNIEVYVYYKDSHYVRYYRLDRRNYYEVH